MNQKTATKLSVLTFFTGVISIVLLLTVCKGCAGTIENIHGGFCYMACHYTVLAAIVIAALSIISSLECMIRNQMAPFLSFSFGIIFLLLPSVIGICAKAGMACHRTAWLLRIVGVIYMLTSLIQLLSKGKHDL